MALICTIWGKDTKDVLSKRKKAKRADMIELRLDKCGRLDLSKVIDDKTIVTCRPGRMKKNTDLLKQAAMHGPAYVDLEDDVSISTIRSIRERCRVIISHHDHKKTPGPAELRKIVDRIRKKDPDLIKIVTMARSIEDNRKIFDILDGRMIGFCMGELGLSSRILAPKFDSHTYCCLDQEAASGQLTLEQMEEYNARKVGPRTEVYGLIGDPVSHSISPAIFNAAFRKKKMDAVYIPFRVHDLRSFLKAFDLASGFSVTVPHKVRAAGEMDFLEKSAYDIGAVNTILSGENKVGFNTDAQASVKPLGSLKGKRVMILGAGGAAKAVAYGAQEQGAQMVILNRTMERAKNLAGQVDASYESIDNLDKIIEAARPDVLINTTTVGMKENRSLVPKRLLKDMTVMDIVYTPPKTKLLKDAEKNGCRTITGLEMFAHQARAQFRLFTGHDLSKAWIINRAKIL